MFALKRLSGTFSFAVAAMLATGIAACTADEPSTDADISTGETGTVLPGLDSFNQQWAYVSSVGDGIISAIDLHSDSVAWTLEVSEGAKERPAESAMGIAASPDGRWVYTGDVARDELVIIDAENRTVDQRIPLPHQIHAIDICERGHVLWVSGRHPDYPWLSRNTIFDTKERKIVRTFTPGFGLDAHYAFTPDNAEVWGASVTTNLVTVYDAHTGDILDAIPLYVETEGSSPEAELGLMAYNEVAISPDGTRAYVVGPESGRIFAIDVASRKPLNSIKVGDRTHGVAVTRDGREVWTANNAGTITVLDADSLKILQRISVHDFANELAFAHVAFAYNGRRAYVSFASDVAVVDVKSRSLVGRIDIGTDPHELSLEDYYVRLEDGEHVTSDDRSPEIDVATSGASSAKEQVSQAGGITVRAKLLSTKQINGPRYRLTFSLAIETHSGDLMKYNIPELISIGVNGKTADADVSWNADSESVHHRLGQLDVVLDEPPPGQINLIVRDIGTEERSLDFTLS